MEELTASANYLPEPDENGKPRINPEYYKVTLHEYIERERQERGLEKITVNNMLSILISAYDAIFKEHTRRRQGEKCNIIYTPGNIAELLRIYCDEVIRYGVRPSLYQFSRLTGIDEGITQDYLTSAASEMRKICEEMLDGLLFEDRTGRIVLANNSARYGMEFEKKQATDREQIRQLHTANELPQLTEMQ